jgi:hypothetical protein
MTACTFGALERVGQHVPHDPDLPRECFWRIRAKAAVLAAGALERPIAFPDERPARHHAGQRRQHLSQPLRRGAGAEPDALRHQRRRASHAVEMQAAGVRVAAVIDSRDGRERSQGDYRLIEGGAQVVGTEGPPRPEADHRRHGGRTEEIDTDCLAMSGGWNPSVHLTCHMNARPVWDADAKAFLPANPGPCPA